MTNCSGVTRAGLPCRGKPMPGTDRCRSHTTREEANAILACREAVESAFREQQDQREPACWSWSPPGSLIDRDPHDWLYAWHEDRCAVCGSDRRTLYLDHDHRTGLIRGWMCQSCNIGEGSDGHESGLYAKYRRRNPAVILGIELMYSGRSGTGPDPFLLPDGHLLDLPHDEHPSYILGASIAKRLNEL